MKKGSIASTLTSGGSLWRRDLNVSRELCDYCAPISSAILIAMSKQLTATKGNFTVITLATTWGQIIPIPLGILNPDSMRRTRRNATQLLALSRLRLSCGDKITNQQTWTASLPKSSGQIPLQMLSQECSHLSLLLHLIYSRKCHPIRALKSNSGFIHHDSAAS